MPRYFAEMYRKLEKIDPFKDLNDVVYRISAEGIESQVVTESQCDLRELYKELYYYMHLTRKTEREIKLLIKKGKALGKHLSSLGNEATAVGAGYALKKEDWFAPAIRDLGTHLVRGLTPYEIMCQICAKKDGPTHGWDASLHFGDFEKRIIPFVSHLGIMLPIASGCAFGINFHNSEDAVLAFLGDGATSIGIVHEALNIAAVKELPMVVVIENNQWAFGTPNFFEFRSPTLALRALGYGRNVEGFLIDGTNVGMVYNTVSRALDRARNEKIISIIVAKTMRMAGHSLADSHKYVPEEMLEKWRKKDPVDALLKRLTDEFQVDDKTLDQIEERAEQTVKEDLARSEKCSGPKVKDIRRSIFMPEIVHENEIVLPPNNGDLITYREAIRGALITRMTKDPNVILLGEDIGLSGGAFKVTEGLSRIFDNIEWPEDFYKINKIYQRRVIDMPLAESGIVGMAVGSTYLNLRPIVEFEFADFSSSAFMIMVNFVANQIARGFGPMPIVFRMPSGWTKGSSSFHSAHPESWFASTPGFKIVAPITSFDARGLLNSAILDDSPVIFVEYKGIYNLNPESGMIPPELNTPVPEGDYTVPFGRARILKEGVDATVISYGSQMFRAIEAVKRVEAETGKTIEIIDLRSLIPVDFECISESIKKTSRVLVTCEASKTGCFGQTIVSRISEESFEDLDAPVVLIAAEDTPVPFSPELEELYLPTVGKIVSGLSKLLEF
ncbi:MAG: hypothetical protein COV29_02585 [Candidatus Yanofskybacteria bacterium CG10_big_fil_rev_8_21_14_0_10_36_16]|uniref:Transketolase-like pyrimidine-binding domain-containing protein n=1 Tax=Candidatus Yanofskybacteria bacterium CG10_big_fil_rev_8_21_14_0_10_36_16 TaxID=1975096 RepID=A0A2J0Q7S0_9BACT|nr:MAG: hypothetical protein COV29_02585 [Candidatus Yanofskybacteria bacterium CG10_big_fil_rev_8_21_14_0_10_36_16]